MGNRRFVPGLVGSERVQSFYQSIERRPIGVTSKLSARFPLLPPPDDDEEDEDEDDGIGIEHRRHSCSGSDSGGGGIDSPGDHFDKKLRVVDSQS